MVLRDKGVRIVDEHWNPAPVRVVISGVGDDGKSRIVFDEPGSSTYPSPMNVATALWETTRFPLGPGTGYPPSADRYLPAPGGMRIFSTAFIPDKVWQRDTAAVAEWLRSSGLSEDAEAGYSAFHQTATLDIVTVISGEIYCVMEDGETLLRQGDTLIQPGVIHAWSNRSDDVAVILAVMISTP
jgi:hypothetical protein